MKLAFELFRYKTKRGIHMQRSMTKIKVALLTTVLGSALILTACGNKGGDGGGTVAQTPCNGPTTAGGCNPGAYSQTPGLTVPNAVPYYNGSVNGYCGCENNSRPIYNPQWGFACAPTSYFQNSSYMGYSYGSIFQPQNYGNANMQQISYSPASYGGSSCYTNFASSCDVRIANSCGTNGYCRAIGGASTVGLCTTGNGTDYYNGNNYNSGYNNSGYPNPNYGTYTVYPGYMTGGYYSGGYGGYYGGGYGGGGNCRYRQNSWGLAYWYCLP
jgi:hypothetical protein